VGLSGGAEFVLFRRRGVGGGGGGWGGGGLFVGSHREGIIAPRTPMDDRPGDSAAHGAPNACRLMSKAVEGRITDVAGEYAACRIRAGRAPIISARVARGRWRLYRGRRGREEIKDPAAPKCASAGLRTDAHGGRWGGRSSPPSGEIRRPVVDVGRLGVLGSEAEGPWSCIGRGRRPADKAPKQCRIRHPHHSGEHRWKVGGKEPSIWMEEGLPAAGHPARASGSGSRAAPEGATAPEKPPRGPTQLRRNGNRIIGGRGRRPWSRWSRADALTEIGIRMVEPVQQTLDAIAAVRREISRGSHRHQTSRRPGL